MSLVLIGLCCLTLLAAACDGDSGDDGGGGTTGDGGGQDQPAFTVQRLADEVLAGLARPLSQVTGNAAEPFPEGSLVSVDTDGEAVLEGNVGGSVCRVFVFFNTSLQKKACPESTFTGGNVTCLEEGSAVFGQCSNMLVQTPSAEFQLTGTWVQVTYQPRERVSVLVVNDGRVRPRPVTSMEPYTLGEGGAAVRPGEFYYTAPDEMLRRVRVPGVPPRQALSWDELPAVVEQYDLGRWMERGNDYARDFDQPYPAPERIEPTPPPGGPDLVSFLANRDATETDQELLAQYPDSVGVPVRVVIVNQGGTAAGPFKVSVDGTGSDGTFVRAFTVASQDDRWYPRTSEALAPGAEVAFDGLVLFPTRLAGQPVSLVALADSCSGEEFVPAECYVAEEDEGNNASEPLKVDLPVDYSRIPR